MLFPTIPRTSPPPTPAPVHTPVLLVERPVPALVAPSPPPTSCVRMQLMEGTFTLVAAMNVTHAAKDTVIAPGALPDSGDLHLVRVCAS